MAVYLVGSDIGTSGAKSVVMAEDGTVLGSHYIEYPLITPRPGWAEQDPEWYYNAVADTIKAALQMANIDSADVKGVSVSAFSPACILIDKDQRPLQNSHIWMDRRGTAEAKWVRETFGEAHAAEKSMNPIDPYFGGIKLLWEKNERTELYKKADKFLMASNYVTMRLTGRAVIDYGNASIFGMGFKMVERKWDSEALDELGLDQEKFPELYACDEVIGEITGEAAERTGLKKGTPVVAGTVDCNAAYVANGAIHDGDISIAMGTAGCMGHLHQVPEFNRRMINLIATNDSRKNYITLGATVSCGALTRYFRDNFGQMERQTAKALGIDEFNILELEAQKVPAGSEGLMVLPYFMGERTPYWNPLSRGVVYGLSLTHTRGHMYRAMIEGATYALLQNYKLIESVADRINLPVILTEGGSKSALWRQIVADMLNVPVVQNQNDKGAPVGNAISAGVGVGVYKDFSVVDQWVDLSAGNRHEPDPKTHELYEKYYELFLKLYEHVEGDYEALADITGYR